MTEPRAPTYLGDGVYASFDGWNIDIWTSNGLEESEKICLEPEVIKALNRYNDECWKRTE